jgi:hypothetical protein
VHTEGLLSLPYGAALPEREMAAARAIAAATPRGASVYVSGQLAPEAVYSPAPLVTPNRAGFPSQYVRTDYLSRRWRGVVTSLLAFEGKPVYGLVTRHSTELRQPVEPTAADYVLLDETEDPRLYGALPADLARAAGRLRLYRNQHAPTALLNAIRGADGQRAVNVAFDGRALTVNGIPVPAAGLLPPAVLPVGDSLPGWGRTIASPRRVPSAEAAPASTRGHLVMGVQALQPTYLRLDLGDEGSTSRSRMVAVEPGLTWYTSPALTWPAGLSLAARDPDAVRLVAVIVDKRDTAAESLDRSTAGTDWPLLTATTRTEPSGDLALDVWYSYAGPREGPYRTVLRDAPRLWETGPGLPVTLHPGPGERTWIVHLQPGAIVVQQASDGRQPPRPNQVWAPDTGERWVWFELGPDGDASLHSVPVAEIDVEGRTVRIRSTPAAAVVLPLLAEPVPPPRVEDGTLVKGSGDAVYYVDHGRLRWVPSPDILQRMGIVWRLTSLSDLELERLPVGLPLG